MFSLKIDSFRGYENQEFKFSKYNILIGENSGGKTSLIKMLMLLKQSMRNIYSYDNQLQLDGPFVDVGLFSDFVRNHDVKKKIKVTYTTSTPDYKDFFLRFLAIPSQKKRLKEEYNSLLNKFARRSKDYLGTSVSVTYSFGKQSLHDISKWSVEFVNEKIGCLKLKVLNRSSDLLDGTGAKITFAGKDGKKCSLVVRVSIDGFMVLVDPQSLQSELKKIECLDETYFDKFAYLLLSQNDFASKLDSLNYLNPILYHPERYFLKRDKFVHSSATDYKEAIAVLRVLMENPKAKKDFDSAISFMGLANQVSIDDSESSPVISLKTLIGGVESNIVDVGYGVSLQVPILMQLIYMKYRQPGANIILEQPEIHLHPALQAKFMETLAKFGGINNSFFIETHSEHMLRKLQVLVKKNVIAKDEVAVYYFKNENGTFSVSKHDVDERGFIQPSFPKEFYDTDLELALELM